MKQFSTDTTQTLTGTGCTFLAPEQPIKKNIKAYIAKNSIEKFKLNNFLNE